MYTPRMPIVQPCNIFDCPKWLAQEWSPVIMFFSLLNYIFTVAEIKSLKCPHYENTYNPFSIGTHIYKYRNWGKRASLKAMQGKFVDTVKPFNHLIMKLILCRRDTEAKHHAVGCYATVRKKMEI